MSSSSNIKVTPIQNSKIDSVDFNNLSFGTVFTDYMFECEYKDGEWQTPEIKPYGNISVAPSARVFHYGQAVFEGMKAYKDENDDIFLFRPEENFKRINKSSSRLAIPEFPKEYFMDGLAQLLNLEKDWIKKGKGNSMYIRPFVIATQPAISASPANEYKFMIILSPAQAYYAGEVRVLIAEEYSRAADGGVGFAKAAGNYAAQFYPTKLAHEKGFQQIIWTDANTHEYLEEAGTMNVFFRINDKLVTAPNNDRILDGITRKSVIQLAQDNNIEVEVRRVSVAEIKEAANNNTLLEIFGTGTATVINPIIGFSHKGASYDLPKIENSYASLFKEKLTNIQYNLADDPHNWRLKIS
ncbi:branched-chain amino acid aminotransferase [Tenacibaculum jejuense]|uniref:Branched-chain-amino-acid aminotransferase n=1 Tax=Tenacibaculum jejuense TaxID=584609 RepID=A0A238UG04_9FLAO|nr:branched-chain amino acid aminotransferase [Tenacibaculum jejuense]SNR17300.1 Branched-chain amino acid aminotransferase/4-amino-4-deoxychorismate lyase family protein [Tenacibaculum jejuense]